MSSYLRKPLFLFAPLLLAACVSQPAPVTPQDNGTDNAVSISHGVYIPIKRAESVKQISEDSSLQVLLNNVNHISSKSHPHIDTHILNMMSDETITSAPKPVVSTKALAPVETTKPIMYHGVVVPAGIELITR